MISRIALASSVLALAKAQQIGTNTAEVHPSLTWQTCTSSGCTTVDGSIVLDSNWRWTHNVGGSTNCYTGNTWDTTLCPNDVECAINCAVDGANYESTYGVTTSGDSLQINFVTESTQANIGARLFLLETSTEYQLFNPLNQEFTFDVNVANLPCGLNGALYFSQMYKDGGVSEYTNNVAGAQYGVGYCDSQCPRDLKWIGGTGNVEGWVASTNNINTGVGGNGSCCVEMDVWEANSEASAYTPHPCSNAEPSICDGNACGGTYSTDRYGGTCDPDGCDFNSYRNGDTTFYGPGSSFSVNTENVFTVVTQFYTTTGTAAGTLSEIRRYYVQNGVLIPNSYSTIPGLPGNSITPTYCADENAATNGSSTFSEHGGFASLTAAFNSGVVLVLSLWDDYYANMLWLDSDYPLDLSASVPGVARGPCSTSSGVPATVEADDPGAYVVYSNIKFGAINSTFTYTSVLGGSGSSSSSSTKSSTSTTSTHATTTTSTHTTTTTSTKATTTAATALQSEWGQCGGSSYSGPTICSTPYICTTLNPYYAQCTSA